MEGIKGKLCNICGGDHYFPDVAWLCAKELSRSSDPEHKFVRFTGASDDQVKWGSCDDPRPFLKIDTTYEVEHCVVYSWHTKIKLVGVPGWFNDA